MRSEKFTFQGHDGSTLAGSLDLPTGPRRGAALFAHCFTCSKDFIASKRIAQALAAAGYAVLRFDFTGLGHSEGEFANTNFTSNTADLVAAAEALGERIAPPALLVGHSLGGAAVLAAAAQIDSVKAVATIAAPADPDHVKHNFGGSLQEIEAEGEAEVKLAGRTFTIRKQLLDDLRSSTVLDKTGDLHRPLLILHAPRDETVGIDNATKLFLAAKHPKAFVGLDDTDHLLTAKGAAENVAAVIAAWASRWIAPSENPEEIESGVRVTELDPTGFLHRIDAPRGRSAIADEPERMGGTDAGLTPFELVGAGLAACTSMTMRMYANRKEWPLTASEVDVTCSQEDRTTTTFRRVVRIDGDLSDNQRARLIEIANRCPVHRMLEGDVTVETETGN